MVEVFLALGSNIGNKIGFIKKAYELLEESGEIIIEKVSSFYFSKAYKGDELNDFVNSVIRINTEYSPFELLSALKNIEKEMGRIKTYSNKYENRPIDIDILFYGEEKISAEQLTIPHVDIENRDFVLVPLKEIQPDKILASGITIEEALAHIKNTTKVIYYE